MHIIVIMLMIFTALTDGVTIASFRRIMLDFLIGVRNRKSAKKIYKQQSLKDRFLLGFILQHIKNKRDAATFCVYARLYLFELLILVPQYLALFLICLLYRPHNDYWLYIVATVKLLLCLTVRLRIGPSNMSKESENEYRSSRDSFRPH